MAEEFLKKVYDRYVDSDYTYGTSNLNPKREITKTQIVNPVQREDEILAKIKAKLAEIEKVADKIDNYKAPTKIDNNDFITDSGPSRSVSMAKQQAILNSGGNSGLIFIPNQNIDDKLSPIENMIQELVLRLTPYLDLSSDTTTVNNDPSNNVVSNIMDEFGTPSIYMLNCANAWIDNLMDQVDEAFSDSNDLLNEDSNENLNEDSNDEIDEDEDSNDDNSSNSSSNNDGSLNGGTDLARTTEELNNRARASQQQLLSCAMMSLSLLQVILMLLKIIGMLKKILILVMNVIVPIVKIAVLVAQCWINPPAIGEAIQLVIEKIEGIVMQLIGMILQAIWDSLQLDCLTSVVQSLLDSINAALAGVDSLYNGVTSVISMVGSAREQIVDPLVNLAEDAKHAKENWKALGNELKDKDTYLNAMKNSAFADPMSMLKNSIPPGIKSTYEGLINKTNSTIKRAKQMAKEAKGKVTGLSPMALKAITGLDDPEIR